jgi:hypothetical protein
MRSGEGHGLPEVGPLPLPETAAKERLDINNKQQRIRRNFFTFGLLSV